MEKRIAQTEERLAVIDARRKEIETALQNPVTYADGPRASALHRELDELEAETAKKTAAWEKAAAELEALGDEA